MGIKREDIPHTRLTVEGLCKLANKLGYNDPLRQLINRDGSAVGDLLYFLEDNPGAIEALIDWIYEESETAQWEVEPEEEDDEEEEEEPEG